MKEVVNSFIKKVENIFWKRSLGQGYDRNFFALFSAITDNARRAARAAVPKCQHLVGIIDYLSVPNMGCTAPESSVIGFENRHFNSFFVSVCLCVFVNTFRTARDYFGDTLGEVFVKILYVKPARDICRLLLSAITYTP